MSTAAQFEATLEAPGPNAKFAAYVVVVPGTTPSYAAGSIDAVQGQLRPSFVERGLIIGDFHEGTRRRPRVRTRRLASTPTRRRSPCSLSGARLRAI
jgi:hypothetical protein